MKDRRFVLFGALAATLALTPLTAHAQDTQTPAPGERAGGRFGGPGGAGGRGGLRGFGNQAPTVATAPIEALASGLKLSETQKQQITEIQGTLPRGRGGRGGRGGQGAQPGGGPADFQAQQQAAVRKIEALLTAEQKAALPAVLKEIQTLRQAGLPVQLLGALNLTADQKARIAEISAKTGQTREQTQEQVLAVLTPAQKAAVEKYRSENPRGGRGGFGGGRGGAGGGGGRGNRQSAPAGADRGV